MKNTLFNYFLNSDGLFKETRRIFEKPGEKDVMVEGSANTSINNPEESVDSSFVRLKKERDDLRKEVDFYKTDKKQLFLLRKEAFQQGKAEALAKIMERQKKIRDLQRRLIDLGRDLITLSGRIDMLKQEAVDKAKLADKVMQPEIDEGKQQLAKCEFLRQKIADAKTAIGVLKEQKKTAPTELAKKSINDQIAQKEVEIKQDEAQLEKELPQNFAKALREDAAAIVKRTMDLEVQFKALDEEQKTIQKTIDELLAETDLPPEFASTEKADDKAVEGSKPSTREEVDAKLKDEARIHNRALGYSRGVGGQDKPIDSTLAAGYETGFEAQMKEGAKGKIDDVKKLDIYEKVRTAKVSPEMLKITTREDLVTSCDIFINKLGLPEDVVLWMGHELEYIYSEDFAKKYPRDSKQYAAFTNPDPSASDLSLIKQENEGFYLALDYFNMVKQNVARIHAEQLRYEKKAGESKKEPVFAFTTEKAQEFFRDFTNAVHDRDYSKLALYGAFGYGVYLFYKNFLKGSTDAKGKGGFMKFIPYALGAYAGGWLIAPEAMKKVVGLGQHIDYKGTNIEGFSEIQRTAAEGTYIKKLDAPTLFNLRNARIEDVFAPMTPTHPAYNEEFANHNMVSLTTPGVARFYPADLIAQGSIGVAVLNRGEHLSVKQKLYLDASRKLFETASALKQMYYDKVGGKTGVSFEDMFLNPKSPHYRPNYSMGSLYEMLQSYLQAESKWTEGATFEQARKDMTENGDLTKAFVDAQLQIDTGRPAGQAVTGSIYGYPITVLKQRSPDNKNLYVLSLRGKDEDKVEYTVGEDSAIAAGKMKELIEKRLVEFSKGVTFGGAPGQLKYEKGVWFFPVTIPAQHLMLEHQGKYEIKFEGDGRPYFDFEGNRMDVTASRDLPSADRSLASDLFVLKEGKPKCNFYPLRYLLDASPAAITISNNKPEINKFDITVLGITATINSAGIEIRKDSSGKKIGEYKIYKMDDADMKKFIDNPEFREKYADARINAPEYENYLKELNRITSKLNGKSFTSKVTGSFTSAYEAIFGDKPLGSVFDGSVPDNYIKTTIEAQKSFLKNLLKAKMDSADTFDVLKTSSEVDIKNRLARARAFASTIDSLPDRALSHAEIQAMVVEPLRSMSYDSIVYTDGAREFEKAVTSQLGVSDRPFNEDNMQKSKELWNVYFHYTASLDKADLDKPMIFDPSDLSISDRNNDREYLKYVRKQIASKMDDFLDGKISSNSDSWGILPRGQWEADPSTVIPALSETLLFTTAEVESELRLSCQKILKLYAGKDYESVAQLLYTTYNTPVTPAPGTSGPTTSLFFTVAALPIATGGYTTRTAQIEAINKVADKFKEQCDLQIHDATLADLKSTPGWRGSIKTWLYEKLEIKL